MASARQGHDAVNLKRPAETTKQEAHDHSSAGADDGVAAGLDLNSAPIRDLATLANHACCVDASAGIKHEVHDHEPATSMSLHSAKSTTMARGSRPGAPAITA